MKRKVRHKTKPNNVMTFDQTIIWCCYIALHCTPAHCNANAWMWSRPDIYRYPIYLLLVREHHPQPPFNHHPSHPSIALLVLTINCCAESLWAQSNQTKPAYYCIVTQLTHRRSPAAQAQTPHFTGRMWPQGFLVQIHSSIPVTQANDSASH